MKKFLLTRIFIFAALLTLSQVVFAQTTLDAIVATVNDTAITNNELATQMKIAVEQIEASHQPLPSPAVLRQHVLKQLIDKELQMQAAKKMGVDVSNKDVDHAIDQIAKSNNITAAQLTEKLKEQGMSEVVYRKEIRDEILLNKVQQGELASHVNITQQEVTDFIHLHRKELTAAPQPDASYNPILHVVALVLPIPDGSSAEQIAEAKQDANKVIQQLQQITDFQKMSISPLGIQYNLQASDLGVRNLAQLPELYAPYLKNANINQIIGPIRAPNGFHILKIVQAQGLTPTAQAVPDTSETHVRHIIIKTTPVQNDSQVRVRLDRLRADIIGGGDFGKIALENSQDPGSVGQGGDLGWVTSEGLDPTFVKVMNETKVNEISAPFQSQFGWHILQVLGRRPIQDKEKILETRARLLIYQRKANESLQKWIQVLRQSSYIKVFDTQAQ